ncbi:MAG: hypothetical protein LBQ34_04890 [Alphaproteobacteria bacterium]|jgi:hypothetical protein|nr:hypothetical protein [Alphaproteobacteria bacterium]
MRKIHIFKVLFISLLLGGLLHADNQKIYVNYGITHSNNPKEIYLTIDLCPSSKKGFDEDLFLALVNLSRKQNRPIPVGIAISGMWVVHHSREFEQLKQWQRDNYLDITWINHSYRHFYNKNLQLQDNFMLHNIDSAQEDFEKNRQFMLERGVILSNFVRFPGLISNPYLQQTVANMGLTTVGARTWFAKTNGKFSGGDIIMLHGNLNEPQGVSLFLESLKAGKFDNYTFASLHNFNNVEEHNSLSTTTTEAALGCGA